MTRTSLDFVWIVSTMLNLNHRLGFHGSTQQMRGPTQYKLNFLCNFERNQTNHFKTKKLTRAKFKQISNQKQHNDNQVFQLFNVWQRARRFFITHYFLTFVSTHTKCFAKQNRLIAQKIFLNLIITQNVQTKECLIKGAKRR